MNHTIVFFEIPADNVAKMKDFYKAVFDWKVIDVPGQDIDYSIFHTVPTDEKGMLKEPGVNGGLYKRKDPSQVPVNYIQVESIEDYLDKAVRNGGKVLMAKMAVPGMGIRGMDRRPRGEPTGSDPTEPGMMQTGRHFGVQKVLGTEHHQVTRRVLGTSVQQTVNVIPLTVSASTCLAS